MNLNEFLQRLRNSPEQIEFTDTMAVIEGAYTFMPTKFTNGDTVNNPDQNNGSCKIFAFGLLNKLSEQQTLACFGSYYRDDVVKNPNNNDHQNIRNFMSTGWQGIQFDGQALVLS